MNFSIDKLTEYVATYPNVKKNLGIVCGLVLIATIVKITIKATYTFLKTIAEVGMTYLTGRLVMVLFENSSNRVKMSSASLAILIISSLAQYSHISTFITLAFLNLQVFSPHMLPALCGVQNWCLGILSKPS